MSRAKDRATSGFRPTLHRRAESLSLESLDMSRAVGRESLDMPKFGRERLDMGRESLDIAKFGRESLDLPKFGRGNLDMGHKSLYTDFRDPCPDFGDQILVCPDFRDPFPDFLDQILVYLDFRGRRRDSSPDFPDSNSRRDYAILV